MPPRVGWEVDGRALGNLSPSSLRRLRRTRVRYLFQRPSDNLYPYLTVAQHLARSSRLSSSKPWVPLEELLDRLGLHDRLDYVPKYLSGGEQQRLSIARAVLAGATLLIADEPTAELDTRTGAEVIALMGSMVASGISVVAATHDPSLREIADQVFQLEYGQIADPRARTQPDRVLQFQRLHRSDVRRTQGDHNFILEVEHLHKRYRRGTETVHAVRGANFALSAGELVGLVGRSGSGKTTLLNALIGWEEVDAGTIRYLGPQVIGRAPGWHDVAILPQKFGLLEELTVRENVEYPPRLVGQLSARREDIEELLEALGLYHLRDRYPSESSVGEQQRTALARALSLSPRLLLADEPTAHQDATATAAILSLLSRVADLGTTCLVATHNSHLAESFDRTLLIRDGQVTEAPRESREDYRGSPFRPRP